MPVCVSERTFVLLVVLLLMEGSVCAHGGPGAGSTCLKLSHLQSPAPANACSMCGTFHKRLSMHWGWWGPV